MESRKRGGRTKGTPNKVTTEIREKITLVLSSEIQRLQLDGLTPRDRVELIKALLPYILPRLQATYIEQQTEPTEIKPINLIEWIK